MAQLKIQKSIDTFILLDHPDYLYSRARINERPSTRQAGDNEDHHLSSSSRIDPDVKSGKTPRASRPFSKNYEK
jgi:hypothetical protein